MMVSSGGVTSTAKGIVSVATFPAASVASSVMSCPVSERPASVYEVASRGSSTGGAESSESWRDARPEQASLSVHDSSTSFVFYKVTRFGVVIDVGGSDG